MPAKKAAPKAHKLAERFPPGTILKDLFKKEWVLGDVVGQGGFGLIYLASEKGSKSDNVIKIEPKNNGPLFCEMVCYQRVAKVDQIRQFTSRHRLQYLAVPPFLGTGNIDFNKSEYRFLVMPRLGTDLQKLLVECGGSFPGGLALSVGCRMLDALQFMHENEYVHADVKAANILLGWHQGRCVNTQVFLVDYGLAYRYMTDGQHKPYKEDPRKAHDGTIEFTSRDAHKGVYPSRRADLEILGYCLMQWLSGPLPWEKKLSDPVYVAQAKESFMQNVKTSVNSCFKGPSNQNSVHADCMVKYLTYVAGLKYDQTPDYNKLRTLLREDLARAGVKDEWKVPITAAAKATKRKSGGDVRPSPVKKAKASTPASSRPSSPKKTPRLITPMTPKSPSKTTSAQRKSPVKATKKTSPGKTLKSPSSVKKTASSAKSKPKTLKPVKNHSKGAAAKSTQNGVVLTPMTNVNGHSGTKIKDNNKRTVKRRQNVIQSEMCTQTSPGLALKKK